MSVTSAQTVDLDVLSQQLHARAGHLVSVVSSTRDAATGLEPSWVARVEGLLQRTEQVAARLSGLARATAATSAQVTDTERALESSMGHLTTGLVWLMCQALPFVLSRSSQASGSLMAGSSLAGTAAARPLLSETPVQVRATNTFQVEAPTSVEQMIERIPADGAQGEQIRIEKYGVEHPVYYVYFGGTADFGLQTSGEPWDMTSNVEAMAAHDAGSVRAAVVAMRAAGISADDQVILVGHSQGGLVAARIAESEQFHVTNVVTVGAPIHKVEVPASTQVLAIEHREDVIPMLSGVAAAGTLATTLTVRRSVAGIPGEPGDPVPAHNRARYIETARELDRTADPRLSAAAREATAPAKGTASVSTWRADREK